MTMNRLTELKQTLDDAAGRARTWLVEEPKESWFDDQFRWHESQTAFGALVGDLNIATTIVAARIGAERACDEDREAFERIESGLLEWAAAQSPGPRLVGA